MRLLSLFCSIPLLLAGCASSMQETTYDPATGRANVKKYAPYFGTRTLLASGKVGLNLVVDLDKKVVPGLSQLQQSLGALGPGDLDATGLFTAYVHNLTTEPVSLKIDAMSHQHQPIPNVPVIINLGPSSYEKVIFGQVGIFGYATELNVEITYSIGDESQSRTLIARRQTEAEIRADVAKWKGQNKNVAAFFPD